jgi:hypothetical protein
MTRFHQKVYQLWGRQSCLRAGYQPAHPPQAETSSLLILPLTFLLLPALFAQPAAKTPQPAAPLQEGFPFTNEALHYTMNWQSGLSLGDAMMDARRTGSGWDFEVTVNAGVPGFAIADKYTSSTDSGICSRVLERHANHAGKRSDEKTTFDQKAGTAHRITLFPDGGGGSTYEVPSCARDAIAFAYYARVELGQGRVPAAQQIYFGPPYTVRMEYGGAENITSNEKSVVTDRLTVGFRGPKSSSTFEVWYARDAARTPLRIRIPASVGTLTLELVR